MKHLLTSLLIGTSLLAGACSNQTANEATPTFKETTLAVVPTETTRLTAVLIHADWCGSCKILDPKLKSVTGSAEFDDTVFVTLDYTQKDKTAFYQSAEAAKIATPVRDFLGDKVKTGQMLLIDMDDQKVLGVITKDMDEKAIAGALQAAAAEA